MAIPVLHGLWSPDLERETLPPDETDCEVVVHADIGPSATGGSDSFTFVVITPNRLLHGEGARWGRGYLIVDRFSWSAVERAVTKLLMHADRRKWRDTAAQLSKEMHWEFEHSEREA
jgi:Immunity protein 8